MKRIVFPKFRAYLLLIFVLTLACWVYPTKAQVDAPTGEHIVEAVNDYRQSAGMSPLSIHESLLESAQAHSQYQAFIGYLDHKGPGGSNETDRAIAAGYGSGQGIICDEAVAFSMVGADYSTFFDNPEIWGDHEHRDLVILNTRYTDIGAGVAEKDGQLYYTVVVCVGGDGSPTSAPDDLTMEATWTPSGGGTTAQPTTTTPTSDEPVTILTSTPRSDGSIVHVVENKQTLWHIAIAYDVKVIDLATMNDISPSNPIVYIAQEILVRRAFTPTISPTITDTPLPPTRTLWPTRTPRPTSNTSTPTITPSPTPQPLFPETTSLDRRTLGIIVIVICGIGLLVAVSLGPNKK